MHNPISEQHQGYTVIREDLIEGGTKRRALLEWLPTLDANHFSYTGSVFGYGAYALALTCQELEYEYSLYISKSKYKPKWSYGIAVNWCPPAPLSELERIAQEARPNAHFLEAGFPYEGFENALIKIFKENKPEASRIWTSVVSGTLVRAMAKAWPDIEIHAVCCARHPGELPDSVATYYAPEKYHQAAITLPPYPSASHTDAKIWQFLEEHGKKGDAIWNLAP
jgi:hypothetical protein